MALVALALILTAVRARYERRRNLAWDEAGAEAEAAEWRAMRAAIGDEDRAKRETDWYINRLDAATYARPTEMEAV